jgi:hypothetical protein
MNEMPAFEVPLRATKLLDEYGLDIHSLLLQILWLLSYSKAGILTEKGEGKTCMDGQSPYCI